MKNTHLKNTKIPLVLFVTTLLVACGGGSGDSASDNTEENNTGSTSSENNGESNNNAENENTAGTGNCVSITSPKAGDISLIKNVIIVGENSVEVDIKRTYTAFSNTSLSYEAEGAIDLLGLLDTEQLSESLAQITQTTDTFTIANNFVNVTKSESTITGGVHSISTYSPPLSAPINEVCEGQTYTQNYTETTTSTTTTLLGTVTGTDVEVVSTKNTIEAVNVQKSTPAGTFNTFQLKSEIEDAILTFWVDTETSTIVLLEQRNAATGDLLSTSTLMTLTSQ